MEGDRKSVRKPRAKARTHDFTDKNRGIRLQKALADAGVAARRDCEKLVLSGAVTVNGHTVDTLPAWVDPATDRVEVYGRPLRKAEQHVHVLLFKPRGTVCTNSDPEGRPRAIDLVRHPTRARLYCVGRLDIDTSGLLVLTNDGEFANRLTHPRYGVTKGYDITLDGSLDEAAIRRIESEIFAASRSNDAMRSSLRLISRDREKTVVHLELCEHRNLQIRPLMLELGFPVKKIRRTGFGPLRLKGLAVGEWRDLTTKEIELLRRASRESSASGALAPKQPRRSMEDFAHAREARAARLAAEAPAERPGPMRAPTQPSASERQDQRAPRGGPKDPTRSTGGRPEVKRGGKPSGGSSRADGARRGAKRDARPGSKPGPKAGGFRDGAGRTGRRGRGK